MALKTDRDTVVADIKQAMLAFADERDWRQFHSLKNLSIGISVEAAELMEHFLWVASEDSDAVIEDPDARRGVAEELADILLFVVQFANMSGIDLSTAVREKLALNDRKYPIDKSRGNSRKYTNL